MNEQEQQIPVDQALKTIASAVGQLKLSLDEHVLLQKCLGSVDAAIKASQVEKIEKVTKDLPTPRRGEKNL